MLVPKRGCSTERESIFPGFQCGLRIIRQGVNCRGEVKSRKDETVAKAKCPQLCKGLPTKVGEVTAIRPEAG